MPVRTLVSCLLCLLALVVLSCSASSDASLQAGMTADQAVAAFGQPDLKDTVTDPQRGTNATRYVWLKPGKAAIIGSDNRVASVQDVAVAAGITAGSTRIEERPAPRPRPFDPIETPLNYVAYPFKVAVIYFASGFNCVATGQCQWPILRGPNSV